MGEVEDTWTEFLEDFRNRTPRKTYRPQKRPDLQKRVIPRWDLIRNRDYYTYHVQTTRGCPFDCDFCCVRQYLGRPRSKPIENVLAEIEAIRRYTQSGGAERIVFSDDNIFANREYTKALFEALIPLRIQWSSQCSINIAEDDEWFDLAVKSGCAGLLFGFESLNQEALTSSNKGFNKVRMYEQLIKKVHDHNIPVLGCFVFGFDQDDRTVFDRTYTFVNETQMGLCQYAILTPFPGSALFDRMLSEGRIFTRDWSVYDGKHVVFEPLGMTVDELRAGFHSM